METLLNILWIIAALYVLMLLSLWIYGRKHPKSLGMVEGMMLPLQLLRLLKGLTMDASLPRSARWLLFGLYGYLLLPVDIVPDFIPVVGQADDVLVAALVLRSVVRKAGPEVITRHWKGSEAGLSLVLKLTGGRRLKVA
jgi:uncharacterized membrane protein YkvA (DUF1232 family)